MALTFPLDLRALSDSGIGFHRPEFRLVPRLSVVNLPSATQAIELAPAKWMATYRTRPLIWRSASRMQGFLDALGGARQFLAYDTFRPWPHAHLAGSGGVSTTYTASKVSGQNAIAITGTSSLSIRYSDLLGLENLSSSPPRYCLVRALEDASAVGGVLTVQVSPQISNYFASGNFTVRINRPVIPMILDPQRPYQMTDLISRVEFSFSAVQATP